MNYPGVVLMAGMMGLTFTALAGDREIPQQIVHDLPVIETKTPADEARRLEASEIRTFSGRLERVDWQKSGESYCQGGGEYYVLVIEDRRYTLESLRDPKYGENRDAFDVLQKRLASWQGRTLTLKGQEMVRSFSEQEHCPDPKMQCMAGEITCRWIRIAEIVGPGDK